MLVQQLTCCIPTMGASRAKPSFYTQTQLGVEGFLSPFSNHLWGFRNRTLVYSVTSPLGRPLCSFQSLLELLQALRNVIKCHRSLCCDAGILHQDVSPGNIVILDPEVEGKPRGILIDFDVALGTIRHFHNASCLT